MKTPKTLHILAAIAMVGVLSLTGCARMPAQSAARERTTPDTSVPAATQDPTLTVEDAKVLALAHLGLAEGDFVKIVRDDGAYELDILSGDTKYEVEVDIRTGGRPGTGAGADSSHRNSRHRPGGSQKHRPVPSEPDGGGVSEDRAGTRPL